MNRTDAFVEHAARHVAQESDASIGVSLPHESAALHVSGEATYTDDVPELQGTLHAALGLSRHAHARIFEIVEAAVGAVAQTAVGRHGDVAVVRAVIRVLLASAASSTKSPSMRAAWPAS